MDEHRTLKAFQLSDTLAVAVYGATDAFPAARPGLAGQMRDAATAVAAALIEGCSHGPGTARAEARWRAALGALHRLGYLIDLAERLGFLAPDEALELFEVQTGVLVELTALLEAPAGPEDPDETEVGRWVAA